MRQRAVFSLIVLGLVGAAACGSVSLVSDGGPGGGDGSAGTAGQGGAGTAGQGGAGTAGQAGAGQGGAGHGGAGGLGVGGALDGGSDASDAGVNPCHGLSVEACGATAACSVGACGACAGGPSFITCYQTGVELPPMCPAFACPVSCAGLAETACLARPDCRADYCSGCMGKSFLGCAAPDAPQVACSVPICPVPCAQVTTLALCEARTDCHSVFVDPGTCGCATAGCCEHFNRCADGDKAKCTGMPLCRAATPFCEGTFVVSYTDTCYEGCVQQKDCAP